MSWVVAIMDPDDNKIEVVWFYLKKVILGTVRGDQFLYILPEVGYKYSVNGYSLSFYHFLISFSHCLLPILYYPSTFISAFHV